MDNIVDRTKLSGEEIEILTFKAELDEELEINADEMKDVIVEQAIQADQLLRKLGYLEDDIARMESEQLRTIQFYQDKIQKIGKKVALVESYLFNYAKSVEDKTIELPFGVLRKRKSTNKLWPTDEVLVAFSKKNQIPVKLKETPIKNELTSYIKETGEVPDGYEESEKTSITVKTSRITRGE